MVTASSKAFRHAVPILIVVLSLVRLIGMALAPLMDTTEARYGEIGRKMAELNDWVTPWFDYGVPYWGKPPLSFWTTAISFKLFGVSEFTARLPHLMLSFAIVGLIGWMTWRRDRDAALPAVACISGSFLYFISAGAVMTDIELVLGTSLSMAGFWIALERTVPAGSSQGLERHAGRYGAAMFFGGLVVGLLAKGPVALVLTGAPLFAWTTYHCRWLNAWRQLPWISGALLTLLISLPWYALAELHTHGFLEYFLVGEHWHRFVTPGWQGDRYGNAHIVPYGMIWPFAFVDTLPWSILLPIAALLWRRPAAAPAQGVVFAPAEARAEPSDLWVWQSYLLIWALAPMLFFTAARNLLMTYVLPALPAAAILAGGWLADQRRQGRDTNSWLSAGLLFTLLAMCGVAIVDLSIPDKMQYKSVKAMLTAYNQAIRSEAALPALQAPNAERAQFGAPLIFIWQRPFSAAFYSHGQAVKVATNEEAWRRIGAGSAYVATRWPDAFLGAAASTEPKVEPGVLARKVSRMGHYGQFDLLFIAEQAR